MPKVDWDSVTEKTGASSFKAKTNKNASGATTKQGYQNSEKAGPEVYAGRTWHRAYMENARRHINDPAAVAYIESRGFTLDQARAWGWGYDSQGMGMWTDTPEGKRVWSSRGRIVLPWGGTDYYHADRAVSPDQPPAGCKWSMKYLYPTGDPTSASEHKSEYGRQPVGSRPSWLPEPGTDTCYVVEGPLDAYALMAVGRHAVALGGASNAEHWGSDLAAELEERGSALPAGQSAKAPTVVVMLDRDSTGRENAAKLAAKLDQAGIEHIDADPAETGHKDADECLTADRDRLVSWLESVEARAERDAWDRTVRANGLTSVFDVATTIGMGGVMVPVPTGFKRLDKALGGGITPGLVGVTAASSMGKTTLITQAAEQMADQGIPVLIVPIEQGAPELMAKGVTRAIRREAMATGATFPMITSYDVLSAPTRDAWKREGNPYEDTVERAAASYLTRYDGLVSYYQPAEQPAAGDVAKRVRILAAHYGRPPVVVVDYLQIMGQGDAKDYRAAVDANVTALRQLARDMSTPVIVISSMARDKYDAPVDMSCFKESGLVEFSCDVALGLQPVGMEAAAKNYDKSAAQAACHALMEKVRHSAVRHVEVKVMKQRLGCVGDRIPFTFYAAADLFVEDPEKAAPGKGKGDRLTL